MGARSECLLIMLAPADVGMFRFLLEARENLGYCTTLAGRVCALKLVFAPGNRPAVEEFLEKAAKMLDFSVRELPLPHNWEGGGSDIIAF